MMKKYVLAALVAALVVAGIVVRAVNKPGGYVVRTEEQCRQDIEAATAKAAATAPELTPPAPPAPVEEPVVLPIPDHILGMTYNQTVEAMGNQTPGDGGMKWSFRYLRGSWVTKVQHDGRPGRHGVESAVAFSPKDNGPGDSNLDKVLPEYVRSAGIRWPANLTQVGTNSEQFTLTGYSHPVDGEEWRISVIIFPGGMNVSANGEPDDNGHRRMSGTFRWGSTQLMQISVLSYRGEPAQNGMKFALEANDELSMQP